MQTLAFREPLDEGSSNQLMIKGFGLHFYLRFLNCRNGDN